MTDPCGRCGDVHRMRNFCMVERVEWTTSGPSVIYCGCPAPGSEPLEAKRGAARRGPPWNPPAPTVDDTIAFLGPNVFYPDGTVTDRRSGSVIWRPGDPASSRPLEPDLRTSDKPHNSRRGL